MVLTYHKGVVRVNRVINLVRCRDEFGTVSSVEACKQEA
jgi:hypothetical protein